MCTVLPRLLKVTNQPHERRLILKHIWGAVAITNTQNQARHLTRLFIWDPEEHQVNHRGGKAFVVSGLRGKDLTHLRSRDWRRQLRRGTREDKIHLINPSAVQIPSHLRAVIILLDAALRHVRLHQVTVLPQCEMNIISFLLAPRGAVSVDAVTV